MKIASIILLLLAVADITNAQKAPLNAQSANDKKALHISDSLTHTTADIAAYIRANFMTENEKARAIFVWLASNIQYDVANMFAINFYEKNEDKITKTLSTRKGICEDYATLFQEISTKAGMKSVVVEGYTKQNGFADYIPHAWAAAFVNGEWLLFDPTWGSGYMSKGKFVRKINEAYCGVKPASLIKTHMPFDYLWEFLHYPVSNEEFYAGKVAENTSKPYFSYSDSLLAYEQMAPSDQLAAAAERIEKSGLKNSMIFDRLHHIKAELEYQRRSSSVDLYNAAVADCNDGLNQYNAFVEYRNKQFIPQKPDPEIQAMLDGAAQSFSAARAKIANIKSPDAGNAVLIEKLSKTIADADGQVEEMHRWLAKYLSKGKAARRSMFYKDSWFGVPLN